MPEQNNCNLKHKRERRREGGEDKEEEESIAAKHCKPAAIPRRVEGSQNGEGDGQQGGGGSEGE